MLTDLWRGDHLMFVRVGTMFDVDTFMMLNAALTRRLALAVRIWCLRP